jgi:hypothetical protein
MQNTDSCEFNEDMSEHHFNPLDDTEKQLKSDS